MPGGYPQLVGVQRFPVLFTGANKAMAVLGMTKGTCYVDVDADEVRMRMSWAFRVTIPRSNVASVGPFDGRIMAWGAHGWRGRWLVNGSSRNVVEINIEPTVRAWTVIFPIRRLRMLRVSVEDRDGLIALLS